MSDCQSVRATFTPFPRLPGEIRRKIWICALHRSSRHVGVSCGDQIPRTNGPECLRIMWRPFCTTMKSDNAAVLSLILACHESRAEVTGSLHTLQGNDSVTGFYFNTKKDIFRFTSGTCFDFCYLSFRLPVDFRHILRHLAIRYADTAKLSRILRIFPALEELLVVGELEDGKIDMLLAGEVVEVFDDGKRPTIKFHDELVPSMNSLGLCSAEDDEDSDYSDYSDYSDDSDNSDNSDNLDNSDGLDNKEPRNIVTKMREIFSDLQTEYPAYTPPAALRIGSSFRDLSMEQCRTIV